MEQLQTELKQGRFLSTAAVSGCLFGLSRQPSHTKKRICEYLVFILDWTSIGRVPFTREASQRSGATSPLAWMWAKSTIWAHSVGRHT